MKKEQLKELLFQRYKDVDFILECWVSEGLHCFELSYEDMYMNGERPFYIIISKEGDFHCRFSDVRKGFKEGLAAVKKKGFWGFIDKTGGFVIPAKFADDNDFSNGLALVKSGNNWGFIDKTGKFVSPATFADAHDFSDGLALVKSGNNWGFIDKTGKFVTPATFADAYDFSNGLAAVKVENHWGYIDKSGELVIPATFDKAASFSDKDEASVKIDGKVFCINKKGEVLYERTGLLEWII